jgi:hypothetical protein
VRSITLLIALLAGIGGMVTTIELSSILTQVKPPYAGPSVHRLFPAWPIGLARGGEPADKASVAEPATK